eukprot:CAMPEP_0116904298 /NCGR_PEP_ID=MMETSP0467-20121206/11328_1 /TAXON_ID=283647 /ORGANISM="Mesodinium pulex, Strain SPMC105" /LENGTH=141 /DNA_ID=CAMNT_0004578901 /DNA_START=336 /DNA_END=761 /DNA_ORIENTATION=+
MDYLRVKEELKKTRIDLKDSKVTVEKNKLDEVGKEAEKAKIKESNLEKQIYALKDKLFTVEKKNTDLHKSNKEYTVVVQKMDIRIKELTQALDKAKIDIDSLEKNKSQKEKYISILLKERNKMGDVFTDNVNSVDQENKTL